MNISIPKEKETDENRVALTPGGCRSLIRRGHKVYLEGGAGDNSGFSDEEYRDVGTEIVYSEGEVWGRADIVAKVAHIREEDCEHILQGQTIFAFHHMAVRPKSVVSALIEKKVTAIGWELISDGENRPVLTVFGEMAGQMAATTAAELLQNMHGGRGLLLGGIPGVPPASIVVLGAGVVGRNAVQAGLGLGGHIVVLDRELDKLRLVNRRFGKIVTTMYANKHNIEKAIAYADAVIGAVLVPAERTPHIITEDMVRQMKKGTVLLDIAIDQGGLSETSRPTTLSDPTYIEHDVIHYCVPNMTSNVSRTATRALTNAGLKYLIEIANTDVEKAFKTMPELAAGAYFHDGMCINEKTSAIFGLSYEKLD